jgi:hypothetical protein
MKTLKIILGILWAYVCLIIVVAMFPGLNSLSQATSRLPFMQINPNYTGGEIVKEFEQNGYSISIHRPVFDGLIGERKKGFVQIDWRGKVPHRLADSIDYNLDNQFDLVVSIDTLTSNVEFKPFNEQVTGINYSTRTSYGWAVRFALAKVN